MIDGCKITGRCGDGQVLWQHALTVGGNGQPHRSRHEGSLSVLAARGVWLLSPPRHGYWAAAVCFGGSQRLRDDGKQARMTESTALHGMKAE